MKIVFHGANAANFRAGFEGLLEAPHSISDLSDSLSRPNEREQFEAAEIIIGIRLGADEPLPRNVKLYQAPAAGTDGIERTRLPKGAILCNSFGHEAAIAEYVMAALLLRHVPIQRADKRLRLGHWDYWAGRPGSLRTELGEQTIGLLGYGHIGRAVAKRAKAFGMRVSVANRSLTPPSDLVDVSTTLDHLPSFLAGVDAVVVSLPLTEGTRGFVGSKELAAMRPDAVLINVGRGSVCDEQALYDSLAECRIGGAILDTWYDYPSIDNPTRQPSKFPFNKLTNVVMTPHMSGWTRGTVRRRKHAMAQNINRFVRGEAVADIVN